MQGSYPENMQALRELLAVFSISVEDDQLKSLDKSLDATISKMASFAKVIAATVAGGALARFVGDTIEMAFQLRRTSDMLGVNTNELQAWRYSAAVSGESADKFDRALRFMEKNLGKAELGMKGATEEFARWGIVVRKGDKVPLFDRLLEFSDKLVAMPNAAQKTRAAIAIFGVAGAQVLPWLLKGSVALRAQREEWKRLGGGMSEEFIAKASDVAEKGRKIQFALTGLRAAAVLPLLDSLSAFADTAVDWIAAGIKIVANSEIVKSSLIVLTGAFIAAGIAAAIAFAPYLLFAAALVIAALAIDDLWVALEGGKSYFRDFLEEKYGPKGADEALGKLRTSLSDTKEQLVKAGAQVGILARQMGLEIGHGLPDFLDNLTKSLDAVNKAIVPVVNGITALLNVSKLLSHIGVGAIPGAGNVVDAISLLSAHAKGNGAAADKAFVADPSNDSLGQAQNDLYNIGHSFDAASKASARGFTSGQAIYSPAPTLSSFTGQSPRSDNKISSLDGAQVQSTVNNEIHIHEAGDARATGIAVARASQRTEVEARSDAVSGITP